MNCLVFLAPLATFVLLLLGPNACKAESDLWCDREDCAAECTELGALRWSCEEQGCLCTSLLNDAKALELVVEVECEGNDDGHKGESPKEKDSSGKDKESSTGDKDASGKDKDSSSGDKETSGKDKEGSEGDKETPGKDEDSSATGGATSNTTAAPAQDTTQGRPSGTASSKKDAEQKDIAQKGQSTTKVSREKAKKPSRRTTGCESNDAAELTPDNKDAGEDDTGQREMVGISLASRHALEPDRGGKGKRKSHVRGWIGAEGSNVHVPFLVRSLQGVLTKKQVMDQLKKQKGDIPMKKIEEFIMKG